MTNTDRLIQDLECAAKNGIQSVTFYVGKYTGNGPSVVAALKRRGYDVQHNPGVTASYILRKKS